MQMIKYKIPKDPSKNIEQQVAYSYNGYFSTIVKGASHKSEICILRYIC